MKDLELATIHEITDELSKRYPIGLMILAIRPTPGKDGLSTEDFLFIDEVSPTIGVGMLRRATRVYWRRIEDNVEYDNLDEPSEGEGDDMP